MYGIKSEMPISPDLRALTNSPDFAPPPARESLPFTLYPAGLPLGALTQIKGAHATQMLLSLLAENPGMRAAWVEERLSAYPPAFVQQGGNLECLLFVQGGEHFVWALQELVRSQVFKVVIIASPIQSQESGLELRRLQIAARHGLCAVIVAAEIEGPTWPFRLRLETWSEEGQRKLRRCDEGSELHLFSKRA